MSELETLINVISDNLNISSPQLIKEANAMRKKYFGKKVYFRGLIEFTNYCKNNCYYCGIRCSNRNLKRYRLSKDHIIKCVAEGFNLGFRTFVLQGGEDDYFTDDIMCDIIYTIKSKYTDCALTLSLGEKSYSTYKKYYDCGASRYLLRHETASEELYSKLHPNNMSWMNRKKCLFTLKQIGFQVGAGFMVGAPNQTIEHLASDLLFLKELQPHMVGIGPFIPHKDTIYKNKKSGDINLTLLMIALTRIILPHALIPATTALGTIDPDGRKKGLLYGANVVMPNISPVAIRPYYSLYNNKICINEETEDIIDSLVSSIIEAGFEPDWGKGDAPGYSAPTEES